MDPDTTIDPKWKGALERALGSWESVEEWADYISFLARLQKAVKSKTGEGHALPLSIEVSESLSRCLDPSLPAGVHQKTLNVYSTIFKILGPKNLFREMNIWLPGLLPLMSYAAFNVKPLLIQLLEKHILMYTNLREICRPILLACLPSVEDEANECFQEIMDLIQRFRERLNDDIAFWQCFLSCLITSKDVRLGSLTYASRYLPSFGATRTMDNKVQLSASAKIVASPNPGVFIRALCAGLSDENVLVQRGVLDLLVKNVPLSSPLFVSDSSNIFFRTLLLSAVRTVLRKDMSLNRRLWSWWLGPEPDASEPVQLTRVEYFGQHAASALVSILRESINEASSQNLSRVLMIGHSLMDRWEIGSTVIPQILSIAIEKVENECNDPAVDQAASIFFAGVEANYVWHTALQFITRKKLRTLLFLLTHFDLSDADMIVNHVPLICLVLCYYPETTDVWYEVMQYLIDKISPMSLSHPVLIEEEKDAPTRIRKYYDEVVAAGATAKETFELPYSKEELSSYLAVALVNLACGKDTRLVFNLVVRFFSKLQPLHIRYENLLSYILSSSDQVDASLFAVFYPTMTPLEVLKALSSFVNVSLEAFLAEGRGQVEVVNDLWSLHETCGGNLVVSAIATAMNSGRYSFDIIARFYSALWLHSFDRADYASLLLKPTFLILDLMWSDFENTAEALKLFLNCLFIKTGSVESLLRLLLNAAKDWADDGDKLNYALGYIEKLLSIDEMRDVYQLRLTETFNNFLILHLNGHSTTDAYDRILHIAKISCMVGANARISDLELYVRHVVTYKDPEINDLRVSQLSFLADSLPFLDVKGRNLDFFNSELLEYYVYDVLKIAIRQVSNDFEIVAFIKLLDSFLYVYKSAVNQILLDITKVLVQKLDELEDHFSLKPATRVKSHSILVQLVGCLNRIISSDIESLRAAGSIRNQTLIGAPPTPTQLIGNVISGVFNVETPDDRSHMMSMRERTHAAVELIISKCCSLWAYLEESRSTIVKQNQFTTALHIAGRLKTRLRKVTSLLYSTLPLLTLKLCVLHTENFRSATRMIKMFEGGQSKATVLILLQDVISAHEKKKNQQILQSSAGLHPHTLAKFVNYYIETLENDALEDIWPALQPCLNEVATKSIMFSELLPGALQLLLIVAKKVELGKPHLKLKMKKDVADIFQKLVLATLSDMPSDVTRANHDSESLTIFLEVIAQSDAILNDGEKQTTLLSKILSVFVVPSVKKDDMRGLTSAMIRILSAIVQHASNSKVWRTLVNDIIFNDNLLELDLAQIKQLCPIIDKWVQTDKEKILEFAAKLPTYGSNSVLFNWSGSRKLRNLNLSRLAYIMLCSNDIVLNPIQLVNQLSSLWNADSATHVCRLLRALMLQKNSGDFTMIFSFLVFKLQNVFETLLSTLENSQSVAKESQMTVSVDLLIEASKLLDLSLTLQIEDFQLHQWVFVTNDLFNNLRDEQPKSGDLVDKLAKVEKNYDSEQRAAKTENLDFATKSSRRPLLSNKTTLQDLHAFFKNISVSLYQSMCSMAEPDYDYCRDLVLQDLFSEPTAPSPTEVEQLDLSKVAKR